MNEGCQSRGGGRYFPDSRGTTMNLRFDKQLKWNDGNLHNNSPSEVGEGLDEVILNVSKFHCQRAAAWSLERSIACPKCNYLLLCTPQILTIVCKTISNGI